MIRKVSVTVNSKTKYYFIEEMKNTGKTAKNVTQNWKDNMRLVNHKSTAGEATYLV